MVPVIPSDYRRYIIVCLLQTTIKTGCEGAAYTQLVFASTAPAPRPLSSLEVTIDRPFFYYIADKNNVPVFAGIIGDPTAKDEQ